MNAAQARPMQSPMLALLDELHYVFFVIYVERRIADTKTCYHHYRRLYYFKSIFYRFILFIAK